MRAINLLAKELKGILGRHQAQIVLLFLFVIALITGSVEAPSPPEVTLLSSRLPSCHYRESCGASAQSPPIISDLKS